MSVVVIFMLETRCLRSCFRFVSPGRSAPVGRSWRRCAGGIVSVLHVWTGGVVCLSLLC